MSITKKLMSVFVVLSLIWVTVCGISFKYMFDMKNSYSQLLNQQATALAKIKEIQYLAASQNYALYSYLLTLSSGALTDSKSMELLDSSSRKLDSLIVEFMDLTDRNEDKGIVKVIQDSNKNFRQKAEEVMSIAQTNRVQAVVKTQSEVGSLSTLIISNANELSDKQQKLMNDMQADISRQAYKGITLIAIISLIIFVAAVLASYWMARRLAKPLIQMVKHTAQIASGDLQVKQTRFSAGRDEIGKLSEHFNQMTGSLRGLIERIARTSDEIGSFVDYWRQSTEHTAVASRKIAVIMQDVQSGALEQKNNVGLTNQSAEEMSNGIRQITASANQSAAKANDMLEMSLRGNQDMSETIKHMDSIQKSVISLQNKIHEQSGKTEQIGKIVNVISAIARQTDILALNASIEASRAGTHGRGFAVIAQEVRNLSGQTHESARKISQFVDEVMAESQNTVHSVENSIKEVEEGISVVRRAGDTFVSMLHASEHVSQSIQEVSAAAVQIQSQTGSVVCAIEHIAALSQETTEKTQEVSFATEEQLSLMEEVLHYVKVLTDLSDNLKQTTQNFML